MSDFNNRQFKLIERQIDSFMHGSISLSKLIDDLYALLNVLKDEDEDWKERFLSYWWDLEQVNASTIYNKQKSEISDKIVEESISCIKKMIKFKLNKFKVNLTSPTPEIDKIADDLGDRWFMCPVCQEAWESCSINAVVSCPKCESKLHNPRFKERKAEL